MKPVWLWGMLVLVLVIPPAFGYNLHTITKNQYPGIWLFKRPELQLLCTKHQAIFVINITTLAKYPLNSAAVQQVKQQGISAYPLQRILIDGIDEDKIANFIEQISPLCH